MKLLDSLVVSNALTNNLIPQWVVLIAVNLALSQKKRSVYVEKT